MPRSVADCRRTARTRLRTLYSPRDSVAAIISPPSTRRTIARSLHPSPIRRSITRQRFAEPLDLALDRRGRRLDQTAMRVEHAHRVAAPRRDEDSRRSCTGLPTNAACAHERRATDRRRRACRSSGPRPPDGPTNGPACGRTRDRACRNRRARRRAPAGGPTSRADTCRCPVGVGESSSVSARSRIGRPRPASSATFPAWSSCQCVTITPRTPSDSTAPRSERAGAMESAVDHHAPNDVGAHVQTEQPACRARHAQPLHVPELLDREAHEIQPTLCHRSNRGIT